MMNHFETYFDAYKVSKGAKIKHTNFNFCKTLGQFENVVFVIMSTRENTRLTARASLILIAAIC